MSHVIKYSIAGRLWRHVILALVGGLLLTFPHSGEASFFTCTSGNIVCLINAINVANGNGEGNLIELSAGVYTLSALNNSTDAANGLPPITSLITIRGANAASTVIERHPNAPYFRLFYVTATGKLQLEALTLRNGGGISHNPESAFPGAGGAIVNEGTLTLKNVILKNNSVLSNGGCLSNSGTAIITKTTLTENEAGTGVGCLHNTGTMTITDSAVVRNHGSTGGIRNFGTLSLTNSTLSSNGGADITGFGGILGGGASVGALDNEDGLSVLTNVTIFGNSALPSADAGGIHVANGSVKLINTILAGNEGGDCDSPLHDLVSLGHNMFGHCQFPVSERPEGNGETNFFNPRIGDLVDTGQPGQVYNPVFPGSLAINSGDDAFCPALDQRGQAREGVASGDKGPFRYGTSRCDIGAVEFRSNELILAPDLIESFVSNPPTFASRGSSFSVQDYVKNIGAINAGSFTTSYYLSTSPNDLSLVLLTRSVPSLAAGAVSDWRGSVMIPSSVPSGSYFLVVCADTEKFVKPWPEQLSVGTVNESNESNNCRASGSLVIVK